MKNVDPFDEHDGVEDCDECASQSEKSEITINHDGSYTVPTEPKIVGHVVSTLSDVIVSLNEDELRILLNNIQNRKSTFDAQ